MKKTKMKEWSYEMHDGIIWLRNYKGTKANIVVPNSFEMEDGTLVQVGIGYRKWFDGTVSGLDLGAAKVVDFDEGIIVGDCHKLFYHNENLEAVDLFYVDLSNVTSMRAMFSGCKKLECVVLNSADPKDTAYMFANDYSLKWITNGLIGGNSWQDGSFMFYNCGRLSSAQFVYGAYAPNLQKTDWMFAGCTSLEAMNVSGYRKEALNHSTFTGINPVKWIFR